MKQQSQRKQKLYEENLQRIGNLFNDIQNDNMLSKTYIYKLIEEYIRDQTNFINGLEQCFLKIVKAGAINGVKKKSIEKFEKVTEYFFQTIYSEATNVKNKTHKIEVIQVYGIFDFFEFFYRKFLFFRFVSAFFGFFLKRVQFSKCVHKTIMWQTYCYNV